MRLWWHRWVRGRSLERHDRRVGHRTGGCEGNIEPDVGENGRRVGPPHLGGPVRRTVLHHRPGEGESPAGHREDGRRGIVAGDEHDDGFIGGGRGDRGGLDVDMHGNVLIDRDSRAGRCRVERCTRHNEQPGGRPHDCGEGTRHEAPAADRRPAARRARRRESREATNASAHGHGEIRARPSRPRPAEPRVRRAGFGRIRDRARHDLSIGTPHRGTTIAASQSCREPS